MYGPGAWGDLSVEFVSLLNIIYHESVTVISTRIGFKDMEHWNMAWWVPLIGETLHQIALNSFKQYQNIFEKRCV